MNHADPRSLDTFSRYAIYFAPADESPHARFGERWLAREAASGRESEVLAVPGFAREHIQKLTVAPRRYGLHATLKPPFALASGYGVEQLDAALIDFAREQEPFSFRVDLQRLKGFLAWLAVDQFERINAIAGRCVEHFDRFRAPMSAEELARRNTPGLSREQQRMLLHWGYPYVFDTFRFHITLTDHINPEDGAVLLAFLRQETRSFSDTPLAFDAVSLFGETAPGRDFRLLARYGFDGSVKRYGDTAVLN